MQALALYGTTTKSGLVYAGGGTFKFPTTSAERLGEGKWQAGPAVVVAKVGGKLLYGVSVQHWCSYAGDQARPDAKVTDLGYFVSKPVKRIWSIGTSPTFVINGS